VTTHFLSDIDLDQEDQLYEGLIVEPPVITRKLLDPVFRTLEMQTVEYALSNANGRFAAAYVADPKRFKGRATEIERYDAETGFILPRFTGEVTRARLERALLRIEAASVRWSVLEQLIPKASTVDTAGFPRAKDLGKTIPLVLGNVPLVPAVYVNENITGTVNGQPSGQFDFLIGRGAVGLFTGPDGFKVYRSPERTERTVYPVNDSEYTLSTGLYPGYTTLRFTVAQWDWNNARDQIWANVAGLQPERNFARAIRTILSNTTWGLSQAVNAASFDAAEALLNGIGSLFCDGVILEPTQAQDILRQLGMVRGMILGLNAAGEWTLTVDTLRPGVSLVLGDGPGDGPRNLVSCSDRDPLSTDDMTRDLILKYRVNLLNDTPMHEQRRVVSADFGKDRTVQADFIRNHTTAKKVKNYLGKRLQYGEETVRVSLTQ
jgi:hypothetical protein